MERRKALVVSAVAAATMTASAVAFVAGNGMLAGANDNVGNLMPTSAQTSVTQPTEVTVVVDPVTGKATTVAPPPAVTAARPAASTSREQEHEQDHEQDHKHEDGESDD